MLRFALKTLKQLIDRQGKRTRLREKLLKRALQASGQPLADPRAAERTRSQNRQTELRAQVATIEFRMARERNDGLYEVLSRQYGTARAELTATEEALRQWEAEEWSVQAETPEAQVETALGLLDDVTRVTTDAEARADVNTLLQRLGIRIGLNFGSVIKGKKRVVQRLLSGRMVFGDAPLPVPLFGKDHVGDHPQGGDAPALPKATVGRKEQTQETHSAGIPAACAIRERCRFPEEPRENAVCRDRSGSCLGGCDG